MRLFKHLLLTFLIAALTAIAVSAQTAAFTYQGRLNDSVAAANGNYDMQFRLFDNPNAGQGMQQGSTITNPSVPTTNGVFTAQLDFGTAAFAAGADLYLEISLRPAGSAGGYQSLAPRQRLTSAPYALHSLNSTTADNATNLGGTAANQFVQTSDSRLSDSRLPTAGGANYIQNTMNQQNSSNFNISGTGSAAAFNAATQYNIGGNRVLSIAGTNNIFAGYNVGILNTGGNNSFVGVNAGANNTTGGNNSFIGNNAGYLNTTGSSNSFVGQSAGQNNTTGSYNSFFGQGAGFANTTGVGNSFIGTNAGQQNTTGNGNSFVGGTTGYNNTTGSYNSFVGQSAGSSNTAGSYNSFVGQSAGLGNTTGNNNSFFGEVAGAANTTGSYNSFFGMSAGESNTTGNYNSFLGYQAGYFNTTGVGNSFFGNGAGLGNTTGNGNSFFGASAGSYNTTGANNSFFGRNAGNNNTTGFYNAFFGDSAGVVNTTGASNSFFGDSAGLSTTSGNGNSFVGVNAGQNNTTGAGNSFFGTNSGTSNTTGSSNTIIGNSANVSVNNLTFATAIGAGSVVSASNTIALGRSDGSDKVVVYGLGSAGSTTLCRNSLNQISTCSSSLRYKTNIAPFRTGLNLVNRLRPITFNWRDGGMKDLGLGAEDVAKVEPLLVTYNSSGEVEGVKYDRIAVVLLNAVKEQQMQIETQQKELEKQQIVINALRKIVCHNNRRADICIRK